MSNTVLHAEKLCKNFGGVTALEDYNISLKEGELFGLIGPNGAGKTTVFNLFTGVIHPTSGNIYFREQEITRSRADKNTALGIARTFQNIRLFEDLSVLDNIKIAFHMHYGRNLWPTILNLPGFMRTEREIEERSLEIMNFIGILNYKDEPAGSLPYGDQRKVELARALATDPKLILLDEPTAGLNPKETEKTMETISHIFTHNALTILLVEHDMKVIMGICQRIQVLDQGKVLALGTPDEIQRDQLVIEAYLGKPRARRKSYA